jgi:glutaredoxin-like protein
MLKSKEGQRVPNVIFRNRKDGEWQELTTEQLFGGRTVVVFALPGAFTPTCSSSHVPRYNALAPTFKAHGVDEIVCISVNDGFVMDAWRRDQAADNITFVADGNGEFSEAMGMLVGKQDLGFGKRSWRYSMLVKDGVIEKMFIEPDQPGDPFEVSDADTMLKYIDAGAELPAAISILTKPGCPYCAAAKAALREHGLAYEEIVLGQDASYVSLEAITGATTVPQVFINGARIGGHDDLVKFLDKEGLRRVA